MPVTSLRIAAYALSFFGLMGCDGIILNEDPLPSMRTTSTDVDAFAKTVLNSIQERSIAETREYCGFIFETQDGGLATTLIQQGSEASCSVRPGFAPIVASFHTHGSYAPQFDNEVPSVTDALNDFNAGIDGYVSTPAGRLWLLDHETGIIRQLCGPSCLISDPNDNPRTSKPVPRRFTLDQLRARFGLSS